MNALTRYLDAARDGTGAKVKRRDFAARIGVHPVSLARYEAGTRVPSRAVMARIVAATDGAVSANDFYRAPTAAESVPAEVAA